MGGAGDPPDHDLLMQDDWKEVGGSQAEWEADVKELRDTYEEFRTALTAADDEGLQHTLRLYQQSTQTQAVGLRLMHVFTHDIYHAVHIQYLRALQ
jgi:uncharacterized damage-inducible protein DinB